MGLVRAVIWVPFLVALWSCAGSKQSENAPAPVGVAAAPAPAAAPEQVVLTDANGLTIYYFDLDKLSRSTCVDECSAFWFPLRPQPGVSGSNFTVITRADGTPQVAYKGRPLYTYHRDKQPGDMKGDGQRGRWHALRY